MRVCIVLYNLLMIKKDKCYLVLGFIDNEDEFGNVVLGLWRN